MKQSKSSKQNLSSTDYLHFPRIYQEGHHPPKLLHTEKTTQKRLQ